MAAIDNLLDWGVGVVLYLQGLSPTLDIPFKILTFMGNGPFFLLLLPFIYWCLDRRTGVRLTILFFLSSYVNSVAKNLAAQPRPFQYDDRVRRLVRAGGGGFPSGHTQGAVVVWGYLASVLKRPWAWVAAGLLMILIPLSRMYLGVHFPTDLLGGYLMGTAVLWLYLRLEPGAEKWLNRKGFHFQLALAACAPLLLILIYPGPKGFGIKLCATLMGMGIGFVFERRKVCFDSKGIWWKRAVRFLLGATVLFALWYGLKIAFSSLEPKYFFGFLRHFLVGIWGGLGAPWVFVKLGLAENGGSQK
jgi:membrane-associated phospholipid phosphatase